MSKIDINQFAASCSAGMEKLVGDEISSFGGQDVKVETGVVNWRGDLETGYRTCLWSRFSSRILLKIGSFKVSDFDSLYEECKTINWCDHLDGNISFAVSCAIADDSVLNHSHFASLRVKDAVVDQFREMNIGRPQVEKDKPDVRINLYINADLAILYIDLSGESLHRRGYRDAAGIAPLKETLGAAIVALAGWSKSINPNLVFLDPMCGSGTLLIEAALIYGDSAPGLYRNYFGFNRWLGHDSELWENLVGEAVDREELGLEKNWPKIMGYDADPVMVSVARKNIENAGLEEKIQVKCTEIARLKKPAQHGFIVSNLPYGERLSELEEVKHLYRATGRILKNQFSGWNCALFISQPNLGDIFNLKWQRSHKLYNGPISCRLFTGLIDGIKPLAFSWKLTSGISPGEGADFTNRLRKNFKRIYKWSQKNKVSCFRIYDRDLPEYNVAIDMYEKWILVQEFLPPLTVEEEVARRRFSIILQNIRDLFGVKRDRVFIKQRRRQRGKKQYEKRDTTNRYYEVHEGNCFFLVNFTNYLDSGIFLDHRPIRKKIAQLAAGKRFLNLFGYTGTATVHAALGGATLTSTVDLSGGYLNWARCNLALNGVSLQHNEIIQKDCLTWVRETQNRYDLIFIDPPTFSNTKKKKLIFDIQKDHFELIVLAMRLLDNDGLLIFSSNFRNFRLDKKIEERFVVSNISKETIPFDFQRNKNVHKCWEIRKIV